jgi:uncharacterized protein YbjT (DUF2867 family)
MQPIAADDVADALAEVVAAEPAGTVEIAGPEPVRQDELVRRFLAAEGDNRQVVTDPDARYFGAAVDDTSLVPLGHARLGATRFADWLTARRTAGV